MSWRKVLTLTYNYCKTIVIDLNDFDQNKNVQDFYSSHPGPINDTWNQQRSRANIFIQYFYFLKVFFLCFSPGNTESVRSVGGQCGDGEWAEKGSFVTERSMKVLHFAADYFYLSQIGISYYPGSYLPSEVGHSAKRDRKIMGTFFVIFHRIIYQISHFILLPPLRLKRGRRYGQTGN